MELANYEQQMKKAIAYLEQELMWLQVWRATTWLVDNLNVTTDYWVMKLNALAHVTVMDNTTLKSNLGIKLVQRVLLMLFMKLICE